jgi:hypothetical protein
MTKPLSIDEYDLVSFFEMEPTPLDPDIPWVYNDSAYEAGDARCHVSFAIAPFVKDVRVVMKLDSVPVYELNAMGVEDVRCHNDKGRESLEIIISSRDSIWLRVKPTISISHHCTNQP